MTLEPHTPNPPLLEHEEEEASPDGGPLALAYLSLFRPNIKQPQHDVNDFLKKHREQLGLPDEADLLSRFLERVWPDKLPTTLIASNISYSEHSPEWLLRPTDEGPEAASYAAAHQTLAMNVHSQGGRLVVRYFELAPHVPPRSHEVKVTAPLLWNAQGVIMKREDLDALGRLTSHRAKTNGRLGSWRDYLDWKEELIKQHQIKVRYLQWRWIDENRLAFLVEQEALGDQRLANQELCITPDEGEDAEDEVGKEQPRRSRRRAPPPVELGDVERVFKLNAREEGARQLWAEALRSKEPLWQITIALESAEAERYRQKEEPFPARGLLVSTIARELAPLKYQRTAIQRLVNSQGFCPRLADFLFDSTGASVPSGPLPELSPIPGTRELNPGQVLAVQKALAAPDLCLIQGPPGTGKTTVIAELCLRVAHEGGRVLVASQSNLAVDNALSRLVDIPQIRRLRMGKTERVDEDFRDFLAENVVDHWFTTISASCTERTEANTRLEQALAREQSALGSLRTALELHEKARENSSALQEQLSAQAQLRARLTAQAGEARERAEQARHNAQRFQSLQAWAQGSAESPVLPPEFSLAGLAPLVQATRERLSPVDPVRALDGFPLLSIVKSRTASLEELRRLLAESRRHCEGGTPEGTHPELPGLLAERQRLSESEDEADLAELGALNARIRKLKDKLKDAEWSRFTRELISPATHAFNGAPSNEVTQIIDALKPSSSLLPSIEALEQLIRQAGAAAEHVTQALPELAQAWGINAGKEYAWEQKAAKERSQLEAKLTSLEAEREEVSAQQVHWQQELTTAERRWAEAWSNLHATQEPAPTVPPLSQESLEEITERQEERRGELGPRLERHGRWQQIQKAWLARLRNVTEADRDQVQDLYKRHANVVGMTCNEAGKKEIYQSALFKPFDMVIIDEVSKATPTELLMPMLLGRKVVLVGDHRQLPPMFRERDLSFAEAQEEGEISREKFEKYQRMVTASLFQELFEAAPESLKAMLWVQYRMHPEIMDAVNEFYGGRLQPGARAHETDPRKALEASRQHYLKVRDRSDGRFLEPGQHLLWVDSSLEKEGKPHWEERRGTSMLNRLEVRLVMESLRRLNAALRERGYGPRIELTVESAEEGLTMWKFVQKRMPHAPEPTLKELFAEKHVRVEGRSQKPERPVRPGEQVVVDARRQVGVITFYGAQLKELRQAIMAEEKSLDAMEPRANTVDRFQGMERPIVLVSLVRSKKGAMGEFVRQFQRINVGFSRAQELLIVIGAAETFERATIELPPLEGGAPSPVAVYRNIFNLAAQAGGRRHAWQLLP